MILYSSYENESLGLGVLLSNYTYKIFPCNMTEFLVTLSTVHRFLSAIKTLTLKNVSSQQFSVVFYIWVCESSLFILML